MPPAFHNCPDTGQIMTRLPTTYDAELSSHQLTPWTTAITARPATKDYDHNTPMLLQLIAKIWRCAEKNDDEQEDQQRQ